MYNCNYHHCFLQVTIMMLLLRDTLIKDEIQVYRVIKFYTMSLQCNMLEQF